MTNTTAANRARRACRLRPLAVIVLACVSVLYVAIVPADSTGEEATHVFSSSTRQTMLIELYTSEGCSSCPPAEAYLNGLKSHAALWQRFVPVAFHVDYWDYLGWQDPYARAGYSKRQHRYARHHRATTVYTPAFFVNGEPWRHHGSAGALPAAGRPQVGPLHLELDADRAMLRFEPVNDSANALTFNLAILGMGLESSIQAGERAGADARHEFVVLERLHNTTHRHAWQTTLPSLEDHAAAAYAVVAWVSPGDAPVPLQATGGYLPEGALE